MSQEQFPNARAARTHLVKLGYAAVTPGCMEGAICWVKADEDGYYLVAKSADGARLMHYSGTPEGLPAGALVTSDIDDTRAGGTSSERGIKSAVAEGLAAKLDADIVASYQAAVIASAAALTAEYNERNDCCVHALSLALNIAYVDAHAALEEQGRKYRCCTYNHTLLAALKYLQVDVLEARTLKGPQSRIGDFVRPKGRYIVRTAGHFFAVVNGVALDTVPRERRALRRMWQLG